VAIEVCTAGECVPTAHKHEPPDYPALHPGDTFAWGKHTARIVRILNIQNIGSAHIEGWVEVALR
jgi:hypothetical protein